VQETEEDASRLEETMKHLNYPLIRELVHKLAGRIGQVGIEGLSASLRRIEEDIVAGQSLHEIADRIYAIIGEVQELVRQVKEEQVARSST
jgi:hypothetical protein